jgi:hypothetical protein
MLVPDVLAVARELDEVRGDGALAGADAFHFTDDEVAKTDAALTAVNDDVGHDKPVRAGGEVVRRPTQPCRGGARAGLRAETAKPLKLVATSEL